MKARGSKLHLHFGRIKWLRGRRILRVSRRYRTEKDKSRTDLQKDIESNEFTILTYGENTGEWVEENANLEERRNEISNQIELIM